MKVHGVDEGKGCFGQRCGLCAVACIKEDGKRRSHFLLCKLESLLCKGAVYNKTKQKEKKAVQG
jgi:hypothetical protein